ADGLHCPEGLLQEVSRLRQRHPHWLLTCACHSERSVALAQEEGCDAVLFSPIFPTRSHPGHPGVGVEKLKAVIKSHPSLPIYALGGVNGETIDELMETGCAGVAAIDLISLLTETTS
ncbi:unnamed protein product, partial [Durusdinium trenchii]